MVSGKSDATTTFLHQAYLWGWKAAADQWLHLCNPYRSAAARSAWDAGFYAGTSALSHRHAHEFAAPDTPTEFLPTYDCRKSEGDDDAIAT